MRMGEFGQYEGNVVKTDGDGDAPALIHDSDHLWMQCNRRMLGRKDDENDSEKGDDDDETFYPVALMDSNADRARRGIGKVD